MKKINYLSIKIYKGEIKLCPMVRVVGAFLDCLKK